jgi:hypothetical protein
LKLFFDQFSENFEKQQSHPIKLYSSMPFHQGWEALRSVTLSLDVGFSSGALTDIAKLQGENKYRRSRQNARDKLQLNADSDDSCDISQWRALLHHPFDKVTLLISDASQDGDTDAIAQNEKYRTVVNLLRESLEDMANNSGYDWLSFQHMLDWNVFCQEHDEYDPKPKRQWYRSAELFRFA